MDNYADELLNKEFRLPITYQERLSELYSFITLIRETQSFLDYCVEDNYITYDQATRGMEKLNKLKTMCDQFMDNLNRYQESVDFLGKLIKFYENMIGGVQFVEELKYNLLGPEYTGERGRVFYIDAGVKYDLFVFLNETLIDPKQSHDEPSELEEKIVELIRFSCLLHVKLPDEVLYSDQSTLMKQFSDLHAEHMFELRTVKTSYDELFWDKFIYRAHAGMKKLHQENDFEEEGEMKLKGFWKNKTGLKYLEEFIETEI